MSEAIIDLKDLMERVQDDKELVLELLDIYQEDFIVKRKALGEAITANDLVKVKEIAHSMKGASGNISAKTLHATCLQLETLAKTGTTNGMADLLPTIDTMFSAIQQYAVELKKEFGG